MRALVLDDTLGYTSSQPEPSPPLDEALIRVRTAGICNTDLELIRGYMGFRGVLGHEFVGEVACAPDSEWVGKRVVGEINASCGTCSLCSEGLDRHCPQRTVLGILSRDGAFADYLSLPLRNLHAIPDELTDEQAIFVEPTAAAFEILEQVRIDPGTRVLVLGPGKLGLLVAQVLASAGCEVLILGRGERPSRAVTALSLPYMPVDAFAGPRFPVVVDCTGNADGFQRALALTSPRGTLVLKSTVADSMPMNLAPVVIHEISVIGSRCGPFAPAIAALLSGQVRTEPLLQSVYPLEDGLTAFQEAGGPHALKVALRMTKS